MKGLGQHCRRGHAIDIEVRVGYGQFRNRHSVLSQCAGFVDGKHADRTERLHGRHTSGQHLLF